MTGSGSGYDTCAAWLRKKSVSSGAGLHIGRALTPFWLLPQAFVLSPAWPHRFMAAIMVLLSFPVVIPSFSRVVEDRGSFIFAAGGVSQNQVVGALPWLKLCHLPGGVVYRAAHRHTCDSSPGLVRTHCRFCCTQQLLWVE